MSSIKNLGLAMAIALAAASSALAQQGNGPADQQGNPAANAAASGGGGTHQSSQKTGTEANTRKAVRNQNAYRPSGRVRHHVGRSVYSYYRDGKHCQIIHHMRGPRQRICH